MRTPPLPRKKAAIYVAVTSLVFAIPACSDVLDGPAAELSEIDGLSDATVQASFRVGAYRGGRQTVWVRFSGTEGRVGAYQATLRFDAGVFSLEHAIMTDQSGTGDFGVVNDAGAPQGTVRFAGFSIQGFEVRDVLELSFRSPRPLQSGDLTLSLDVVGTPDGSKVTPDELAVSSDMQPATSLELGR